MSSRFTMPTPMLTGRPPRSNAIALHVLLAVTDPTIRDGVEAELQGTMPVAIDAVEDIAECAAALHEATYDVVIAETDVAGFVDPMLLRLARDTQPSALRVGIVGNGARDVALAILAHFVVAPTEIDGLGERVRRAAALQRAIEDPIVRSQIAQCKVLPSAPTLHAQLAAVLSSDDPSTADVVAVVVQDQEVTARVLQLTNSAFTGRRQVTSDIGIAIAYVGIPVVRGLVLTIEVLRAFRAHKSPVVVDLALTLSAHARDVADASRLIAPSESEAFAAGLLHDIGKLVMASNDPDGWVVVESLVAAGRTSVEAEAHVFGCTHDAVGATLLAMWGLSAGLVEAVANHHRPADSGDELSLAGAVHIADALCHDARSGQHLDQGWVARTGLSDHVALWRSERTALPA